MGNMCCLICYFSFFKKRFAKPCQARRHAGLCGEGVNNLYEVDFNYKEITEYPPHGKPPSISILHQAVRSLGSHTHTQAHTNTDTLSDMIDQSISNVLFSSR